MSVKLLYLVTCISIGGAELMLYKLLSRLNRERFTPVVVSLIDDRDSVADRIEALGIPVYTIGMQPGLPTPQAIWRLVRTVRQLQPDLIQGRMYHGSLAAQLISAWVQPRIPILWSIHHSINALATEKKMTQAIIRLGAHISRFATQIIFVSQNSQQQHEALGYRHDKSCYIPNGCDTSLFQPSVAARSSVRTELNLPAEAVLIGLIARYHPLKDHANFLRAAALLLKTSPTLQFVLIGSGVDATNQPLNQLIQDLGIGAHLHLLGERHDLPRLTAALDIATLSSCGEAFPNVLVEAMACEVPCVTTDVGDAALIVGQTGQIVPPQNAAALATAWQTLLALTTAERAALGQAARARVRELFSLESVVAQHERLYEAVLAHSTQSGGG
jgi:glycosyltransferase involved in cell wall biosynthesis